MNTQLLTVSPAVVRASPLQTPADISRSYRTSPDYRPSGRRLPEVDPPPDPPERPDWHYEPSSNVSRVPFALGLLISASLHAILLLAFNDKTVVQEGFATEEIEITFMEMPPVEELDDPEEVFENNDQAEEIDPGQYVPMQADIPSFNADAVFEQKMDLQSLLPKPDFDSAKVVSIPPRISRTRMDPNKMKDLFKLSDLDRAPTPLVQHPPEFPYNYRATVTYAEVVVDFIVDSKGRVPWAKARSSTHEGFEDSAVLGVSRWHFKPGMKNGRAVNTRMRIPLQFRILDD